MVCVNNHIISVAAKRFKVFHCTFYSVYFIFISFINFRLMESQIHNLFNLQFFAIVKIIPFPSYSSKCIKLNKWLSNNCFCGIYTLILVTFGYIGKYAFTNLATCLLHHLYETFCSNFCLLLCRNHIKN